MNRNLLVIIFVLAFPLILHAQIVIKKESGKHVKLNASGDWEEINEDIPEQKELNSFTYPEKASRLAREESDHFGVQYDPQKWDILKGSHFPGSKFRNYEYEFSHKRSFAVGLLMADTTNYPIDEVITMSLKQIKESATEFNVAYGEVFNVNDKKVYMVMLQTMEHGIPLTYYNYYYSGKEGSIQFLGYCNQKVFWKYEDDIKDLLNGLLTFN